MRRLLWMGIITVLCQLRAFPAQAGELGFSTATDPGFVTLKDLRLKLPDDWGVISFWGRNRSRYEAWDYFAAAADNDYEFGANQLRLGTRWVHDVFNVNAAWQYTHLSNLPSATSAGAGSGSLYFSNSRDRNSHGQFIKYLNVEIKQFRRILPILEETKWYRGLSSTLGRFNYSSGNEMKSMDKKIEWLKAQRIAERLIGGFEWSHYGRSFDGAKLAREDDFSHISVAGFSPTQGGFEERSHEGIEDIDLVALEATVKKDRLIPGMEEQFFYYHYDDHRNIAATTARLDNTGRSIRAGTESDVELHTFGAHAVGNYALGSGVWDILGWWAIQTGDWHELDHSAYAFAVETGYQWNEHPWKPWLRGGFDYGSGDADTSDGDHGTFHQMLPTARLYSFSILYNMMNTEDGFVSLILKPMEQVTVRTEFHALRLSERSDRWYLGSGAIHDNVADDFAARTSNNQKTLGELADVTVVFAVNPDVSVMGYYGHFFGDDVTERFFATQSDSDMAYLELTVNF